MKILVQILLILVLVLTLCICSIKPQMHKSVLIYNSDYKITPETTVEIEKEEIPIMEAPVSQKVKTVKSETITVKTPQKVSQKIVSNVSQSKNQTKTVTTKEHKTTENRQVQNVKEVKTPQKVIVNNIKAETIPVAAKTISETNKPKNLTQQEEEIAWNVWRSNLQNKIMHDVNLPVLPNGTTFKFTFNVDKFGRVSNVQTYAVPSTYTPYAIQYIAPVIRSYQGKDILNFPQGSTRISTEVKGGWKLSENEKYSTPKDYNDYEKVIKTNVGQFGR